MKDKFVHFFSEFYDFIGTILAWILIYFSPTYHFLLVIGFMMFVDTVMGIRASIKKGDKFTSRRLRGSLDKIISYTLVILISHCIQRTLLPNTEILKMVSSLIAYVELKSINENFEKLTGLNVFKFVIDKIPFIKTKDKAD